MWNHLHTISSYHNCNSWIVAFIILPFGHNNSVGVTVIRDALSHALKFWAGLRQPHGLARRPYMADCGRHARVKQRRTRLAGLTTSLRVVRAAHSWVPLGWSALDHDQSGEHMTTTSREISKHPQGGLHLTLTDVVGALLRSVWLV